VQLSSERYGEDRKKTFAECKAALGRKRELAKLAAMPDDDIDRSDLPELTEKSWQNAVPNPFYRPVKKQITLRIEADILAWLHQQARRAINTASTFYCDASCCKIRRRSGSGHERLRDVANPFSPLLFERVPG
jgi:uncharacterized protein (DUF4415 family)